MTCDLDDCLFMLVSATRRRSRASSRIARISAGDETGREDSPMQVTLDPCCLEAVQIRRGLALPPPPPTASSAESKSLSCSL